MMESEVRTCRTRKATKAELKTAEENAEKDLWRTYHKHLGEDGKKKGMSLPGMEAFGCRRLRGWGSDLDA